VAPAAARGVRGRVGRASHSTGAHSCWRVYPALQVEAFGKYSRIAYPGALCCASAGDASRQSAAAACSRACCSPPCHAHQSARTGDCCCRRRAQRRVQLPEHLLWRERGRRRLAAVSRNAPISTGKASAGHCSSGHPATRPAACSPDTRALPCHPATRPAGSSSWTSHVRRRRETMCS